MKEEGIDVKAWIDFVVGLQMEIQCVSKAQKGHWKNKDWAVFESKRCAWFKGK